MHCTTRVLCIVILILLLVVNSALGGRARGAKKGRRKNIIPFPNVNEYSRLLVNGCPEDSDEPCNADAAHIVKGSHFAHSYKLGYKILLVCESEGFPRPHIKWYKDGMELEMKRSVHIYEKKVNERRLYSKIEIDPATVGDQGIYTCMCNNEHAVMIKNFKAEYYY